MDLGDRRRARAGWAGNRRSTAGNPPRRSAPAPASGRPAPHGRPRSGCPAGGACATPAWGSSVPAPAAGGTCAAFNCSRSSARNAPRRSVLERRRRSSRRLRPSVRPCSPHPFPSHSRNAGIGDEVEQIVEPTMRIVVRPTVQLGLDLQYPPLGLQQGRGHGALGIHQRPPGIPVTSATTCWRPSPCDRLSRPRTTTEPPPRPAPSADDAPALPPRWPRGARATPDGSHVHIEVDRRVRRPALPLRHRHGYAADIHRGLPAGCHITTGSSPHRNSERVRTATSPYPPDLSWWAVKGRQTLVSRVHLPVSLAGPAPSGSAGTSRRCQGCSHPPRRLPDQAALSFTQPLRRPGVEGLSPPLDFRAPRGAHGLRPSHPRRRSSSATSCGRALITIFEPGGHPAAN